MRPGITLHIFVRITNVIVNNQVRFLCRNRPRNTRLSHRKRCRRQRNNFHISRRTLRRRHKTGPRTDLTGVSSPAVGKSRQRIKPAGMIAVGIPLGPGITDCICFIGIIDNINPLIDKVRQNVAQPSPAAGRQFNIMHHRSVSRINLIIVIGSGSPLLNKRNSQICRFAQSRCIQPFIINKTVGFDIPLVF